MNPPPFVLRSLLVAALLSGLPVGARAQVFRGAVRQVNTAQPVPLATVTARDTAGNVLAMTTTDSTGLWALRVRRPVGPVELRVRRLGFEMGSYVVKEPVASDTLEYEFLLNEVAAAAEAVRVTGDVSLNEKRLAEAYRRGWRVIEPELVASVRDRTADLAQLLRTLGTTSVYPPRGPNDCFRATRNNQCLAIVVDGLVLGPTAMVLPSDIYFLAILGASEARVQFGDRAPFGAIAIYTRSRYDRTNRRP
jgi:hypothetical protein